MPSRTKVLYRVDWDPEEPQLHALLRFDLEQDGTVTRIVIDPRSARDFLAITATGGPMTLDKGRVFFDALDAAFNHCTMLCVRELAMDEPPPEPVRGRRSERRSPRRSRTPRR